MRRYILPSLGITLLLGVIYGRAVLQNDFVTWDDGLLITENPIIQEFSIRSVHRAFTSYDPELYIPLTFLSYQLDHLLWGLNPVGFHLTNLILHTLNAVLVFVLMVLLLRSGFDYAQPDTHTMTRSWIPLFVALLFAVHPLNVEAVAWAAARKDLLSGFFFLLSVCGYLKWVESVTLRKIFSHHDKWYFFSILSFLLGLLAKVSIAPLPLVILLIDWFLTRRCRVRVLRSLFPYFLLSIVFGVIALGGKHGNTELFSEKILIGAKAAVFSLGKLMWPTDFSVLYPYTRPITWSNPDLLLPLILVFILSALAFLFRKKFPIVAYGWAFFLLMLLPSFTNFAKGHDQLRDVYFASDRYAYLPSIGIFLLIGSLLCRKGIFAILFLLSFLSYRQSHVWHNTETLFRNVTRHYPDSHIAWNNLGSIAFEHGDVKTALEDYDRSLAIRPNAAAFFNLGQIALQKGLIQKAMELYRRAILSRPNDRDAHLNLGVLLLQEREFIEATEAFQKAITIDDTFALAYFNLGLAREALGNKDGARQAYTRALELDPYDQEAREKLSRLQGKK